MMPMTRKLHVTNYNINQRIFAEPLEYAPDYNHKPYI